MFIDPAPAGKSFAATDIDTGDTLQYPAGHEKEGQPLFQRRRFIPPALKITLICNKVGNTKRTFVSARDAAAATFRG